MALRDIQISRGRPYLEIKRVILLALLMLALGTGLTFVLTVPLMPSRYELHEGDVTPQTIRSPRHLQYTSSIETRAERDRASNSVQEVLTFDPSVAPQQRNKLLAVLQTIGATRSTPGLTVDAKKAALRRSLEIDLTDDQLTLLARMDEPGWQSFAATTPRVLYEILSERVPADRLDNLSKELPARLASITGDPERALAAVMVKAFARVNYAPNPLETSRLRREAQDAVAPVSKAVEKGEVILREGDVVRATDLEKLEALGLRNPTLDLPAFVGSALLVLVVLGLLLGYIWVFEPWLLSHERRLLLLALVMFGTVLLAKGLLPGHPYWVYAFPLAAVSMLLATLLDAQLAILATTLLGGMVAVVAGNSVEVAALGLVGAVLGTIGVWRSERLYSYFVAGLLVGVANLAVVFAFRLMSRDDLTGIATVVLLAAANGPLSAVLTVGTFSLLGRLFGITTTMQLLELSDPTQPLLRRLLNEAPGTYHHSIMVGNLAERAAERVGADPLLVRVGAYYHDVGKLARPYFFIENQFDGVNVHDTLDPQTSARIVATHVRDGLELADKYHLPTRVREFISEHHGTRLVTYFFNRASREGNGQVDASQYAYPGPKPRSKEAGIVMLADSVEAVVRSAKEHSPENIAALVLKVVDERVDEGQLDDCDLTIRDMEGIKKAFIETLMGMYHPRIEYPPSAFPEEIPAEGTPKTAIDHAP